ncbi:hypothetical protein J6590_018456 [Homalodisca vitripennis]|nr:hypothetical protein J6590_018456 [Homalodisca vitripennis]
MIHNKASCNVTCTAPYIIDVSPLTPPLMLPSGRRMVGIEFCPAFVEGERNIITTYHSMGLNLPVSHTLDIDWHSPTIWSQLQTSLVHVSSLTELGLPRSLARSNLIILCQNLPTTGYIQKTHQGEITGLFSSSRSTRRTDPSKKTHQGEITGLFSSSRSTRRTDASKVMSISTAVHRRRRADGLFSLTSSRIAELSSKLSLTKQQRYTGRTGEITVVQFFTKYSPTDAARTGETQQKYSVADCTVYSELKVQTLVTEDQGSAAI